MEQKWDAIVIGSGIGGLTAAALLAKVGKMRVLVLEKHYERGGLTHVFRRDGASWDVGVHYVGGMEKGSRFRSLFDFLSGGALEWNRMTDDFERFVYPDRTFAVPSDPHRYQERLIEQFPDEAAAIRRYFSDLREVVDWFSLKVMQATMPAPMSLLTGLWRRRGDSKATQTTAEYLDRHFQSAELKGLLASQWPDYGLPPAESAFVLHALVVRSYATGGWFPQGGSSRIARTFETGIEAHGGAVKVCQEVKSILIAEDGHAAGVRAIDISGVKPTEVIYRAPIVISNAGAHLTYSQFLPTDGEIGRRTAAVRAHIDRLGDGPSAVTLYLRLNKAVSTIGVKGENYWINTTYEHGDLDSQTKAVLAGHPKHAYMSFPSSKSGDSRFHTAEILALVNEDAFSTWRTTEHGMRGKDYLELKDRISQGLLDLAEVATPGLKALVQYAELSTPLSVEDYTSRPGGAIYGLKGTPDRYRSSILSSASPIPGLFLSGSDASNLGVTGALMGGVMAASRVFGPLGFFRIMKAVSRGPDRADGLVNLVRSTSKSPAVVVAKTALTTSIWQIELELQNAIDYVPGQFGMLLVAPFEWRSYSIASAEGRRLTLLVSTRTGGDGSMFVKNVEPGAETEVELPFGAFRLRHNRHRKVFIATGTGLAPFLPMFKILSAADELGSSRLLFGCRLPEENITKNLSPLPQTTVCVSGDPSASEVFHGRVTQALESISFDPSETDFYLCGAPAMINDCRKILIGAEATQIFTEVY
ncbi:oxidoreductase NAD-binding domain protein [Thozetella sp. PMI_491]|nr:oxidoreductase NAD-binding domain protein [Thozetella sp. PMI_491]